MSSRERSRQSQGDADRGMKGSCSSRVRPSEYFIKTERGLVMNNLSVVIRSFLKDEEGVTAIEYGLIAALIAVAIIVMVALVGDQLNNVFNCVAKYLFSVNGGGNPTCVI